MTLAAHSYDMLDQMGIPVWQLRSNAQSQAIADAVETVDVSSVSYVVISDCWHKGQEQQRLLHAIFYAVKINREDVAVLTTEQSLAQQGDLVDKTIISCVETTQLEVPVIALPTLSQLIEQPTLKAKVWSNLMERLG